MFEKPDALFYFFSALMQSMAALFAVGGVFAVFKLQILDNQLSQSWGAFKNFASQRFFGKEIEGRIVDEWLHKDNLSYLLFYNSISSSSFFKIYDKLHKETGTVSRDHIVKKGLSWDDFSQKMLKNGWAEELSSTQILVNVKSPEEGASGIKIFDHFIGDTTNHKDQMYKVFDSDFSKVLEVLRDVGQPGDQPTSSFLSEVPSKEILRNVLKKDYKIIPGYAAAFSDYYTQIDENLKFVVELKDKLKDQVLSIALCLFLCGVSLVMCERIFNAQNICFFLILLFLFWLAILLERMVFLIKDSVRTDCEHFINNPFVNFSPDIEIERIQEISRIQIEMQERLKKEIKKAEGKFNGKIGAPEREDFSKLST